jgi:hydroxymethylpyrimidine pyrophosphatase-like HAD family hydrolase
MSISTDPAAQRRTETGAEVTDLLCGAGDLATRLRVTLRDQEWLDSFLLAAGLSQMVEDRLHADPLLLNRTAGYLRHQASRPARLAGAAAVAAGAALRLRPAPGRRRLIQARHALSELTEWLAAQVLEVEPRPAANLATDPASALHLLEACLPALAGDVLRVPACFHGFDQHPDDVRWLVREFRRRYASRDTPLCVVGVRTSGSYLAPLHAAALRATGDSRVQALTYRPDRPFLGWERSALGAVARAGGLVLITDDPPGTGTSLATTAQAVSAAGLPDQAIIFLLSMFGSGEELPGRLRHWPAVIQPGANWSVHDRLAVQPVARALTTLVSPGMQVCEVRSLGPPPGPALHRGHARVRFAVRLQNRQSRESVHQHIVAEGAGLGYLGRHGCAVAGALPGRVPHVYGFDDGLLYRDWLPPGPCSGDGEALAGMIAGYVAARQEALPARPGTVDSMGGLDPAWEVAGLLLSSQFGPLALPARPLLLEPLMRQLLRHDHPAVLDGKTDLRHWLADPAGGGPRKVDFYQRAFGHLGLTCYDPVCDLAGAAADPPFPEFEAQLRAAYFGAAGEHVDGERWLLYRLAQLWRLRKAGDISTGRFRQRSAAAVHDYLAGLYLRDLPVATGPLCAIDLDGVLECDRLGYTATSPTGALALRALVVHGYQPVLATGRPLPDVRDRCTALGLAGGVAEYGCAVYYDGEAIDLRPPPARALLDQIRDELAGCAGVRVDPQCTYAVRAVAAHGPVPGQVLAGIPALAHPDVRVIHGEGQTDITVAGIDKGSGLHALASLLGQPGWALAVGDSQPDLPMLARASLARAPRNAQLGASGNGITLTRHAYQAGLAQACAALLGHRPGRCPECRAPAFPARTRAVLAVLDLRANGMASIPAGTAALSWLLMTRHGGDLRPSRAQR